MTTSRVRLLDVNVLVALTVDIHVHHARAHRHLASLGTAWATCPMTEAALLRLLLTPQVVGRPVTGLEAMSVLHRLREQPGWTFLADDTSLADSTLNTSVLMGAKQVTDLHLVGLAARHGAVLATFDRRLRDVLSPDDRAWVEVWTP